MQKCPEIRGRGGKLKKNNIFFYLLPALILFGIVAIAPMIYAVVISFFEAPFGKISHFAGLSNYVSALSDSGLSLSLRISFFWALLSCISTLLAAIMSASIIVHKKWDFLLYISLIPWMIPPYTAILSWRGLIHGYGGISLMSKLLPFPTNLQFDGTAAFFWSVFIASWLYFPIATSAFTAAMKQIPGNLVDAARLDGAGNLEITLNVIIPHIRPTITGWFLISFASFFRDFSVPFLLTSGGPTLREGFTSKSIIGTTTTIGVLNYRIFQNNYNDGLIATYSLIFAVVVITIGILWMTHGKRRIGSLLFLKLLCNSFAGSRLGLLTLPLYVASLFKRNILRLTLYVDLLYTLFQTFFHKSLLYLDITPCVGILVHLITTKKYSWFSYSLRSRKWTKDKGVVAIIFTALVFLSVILPIYNIFWMAFSSSNSLLMTSFLPKKATFENFANVFTEEHLHVYMKNTLIVSSITAVFTVITSLPLSYIVSRRKLTSVMNLLLFFSAVSGIHMLSPIYMIFKSIGLLNNLWAISMIYTVHSLPMTLFITKGLFDRFPREIEEAASLDMNRFMVLTKVIVPLSLPMIFVSAFVGFTRAWTSFITAMIFIIDESKYTIGVKLYSFVGEIGSSYPKWSYFAASSLINIGILAFVFLIFGKSLMKTYVNEIDV